MNETQIAEKAQEMFLYGNSRKEVMNFLESSGIPSEKLTEATNNAYQAVKSERKEIVKETTKDLEKESNWNVILIIIGLILFAIRMFIRMAD